MLKSCSPIEVTLSPVASPCFSVWQKHLLCYNSSKLITNNMTLNWVYQKYDVRYKQNHTFYSLCLEHCIGIAILFFPLGATVGCFLPNVQ